MDISFWKGKRVFLTGHTGFKGSWLSRILTNACTELTGYSLDPPTNPNLFSICGVRKMASIIGDIRDKKKLFDCFREANPEIVIHMAAQPLVLESYLEPAYTYEVNAMGTVNMLECIRLHSSVKSFLNITTDKVYHNKEWELAYRESDPLNGYDPYSNSKSCSELITHSYKNSFFSNDKTAISTARAGNVLGGGDFACDRIIPDCIRAVEKGEPVIVRNPHSIRPYQHVLEPLFAYLMIAQKQYGDAKFQGYYNVGPDVSDCVTTGTLVDMFCKAWGDSLITWENRHDGGPYEANYLKLDCTKLKSVFGWRPRWDVKKAILKTVEWTKVYLDGGNIEDVMDKQIESFMESGVF